MTDKKNPTQTAKNEHTAGCLSSQVMYRSKRHYDLLRVGKFLLG